MSVPCIYLFGRASKICVCVRLDAAQRDDPSMEISKFVNQTAEAPVTGTVGLFPLLSLFCGEGTLEAESDDVDPFFFLAPWESDSS